MVRRLECAKIIDGCEAEFRGETDDDVMRSARAHAAAEHGLHEHSPAKVAAVRALIQDEARCE